jgi:hypothetical protein
VDSPAKPPAATTVKESASVNWVAGMKARQCHGDGPLGLITEFPTTTPDFPPRPLASPVPTGVVGVADDRLASGITVPPDPPPRLV